VQGLFHAAARGLPAGTEDRAFGEHVDAARELLRNSFSNA
jgi:hypothetical protein